MLRRFAAASFLGFAILAASPATASVFGDDLSRCLVAKTSEADKTMLVRWVFASIAAADGVKDMVKISDADRTALSRQTADLFVRLITKDCRTQAIAAIKNDGEEAFKNSFAVLGQIAMRGLMNDPKVNERMDEIDKYFDEKALEDFGREAGIRTPPKV